MNSKFKFTNFYELFKPIPNQFTSAVYNYAWKIDNGFEIEMMVKSNVIEIVFKYWGPLDLPANQHRSIQHSLSGKGLFRLAARS